jgi:hypothetical protein
MTFADVFALDPGEERPVEVGLHPHRFNSVGDPL